MESEGDELLSIGELARELDVSVSYVRKLANAGRIPSTVTSGGHRRFPRGETLRAWSRVGVRSEDAVLVSETWPRATAREDEVWNAIAARLRLPERAEAIAQYVTTEMVNNAIDHSHGSHISVIAQRRGDAVVLTVSDDGEGVFAHLAAGLSLSAPIEALAELTKGKRTTDPQRHTGEGIFFSSKAADVFSVEANDLRLSFDNERGDFAYGVSPVEVGTVVTFTIERRTTRSIKDVFDAYTNSDFQFARTTPRIKLYEIGVRFVSRSEAKRLGAGLEQFTDVELDFTGVTDVGQGFADELFRVWARDHPGTALEPVDMNEAIAFMIERARR